MIERKTNFMFIFVETNDDHETHEIEIEETSNVEFVKAMIASIKMWPPTEITLTLDDKVLSDDLLINSLDLGRVLKFTAIHTVQNDEYLNEMFDVKKQKEIEKQIQQENVNHNMQYAYDHNPESFISYNLLFIKCKINNVDVVAMLDTGAQISIIPFEMTKRCNVDYLIDSRFKSTAVGVGVQKIIGRIHALVVVVMGIAFENNFSILDGPLNNIILGVDWLTKNRAIIDLQQGCLILKNQKIPFVNPPE